MILGIDKGTTFTKTSEGQIIRSTIRENDHDILIDNKLLVGLSGRKYIVGERGNYSSDLMKAEHENTKVLIYTMIALSKDKKYIDTDLVVGLPIGLYARQKENMKKLIDKHLDISINGIEKHIEIGRIEVFPEGAGAYYTQEEKDCLIIDIGGLSIDTALFDNGKLTKYSTYSMGIMKLYNKIANRVNSQFDLSLTEWDVPNILKKGLYIYGQKMPIDVESLIKAHTLEIIERLKLEYDIKLLNVLITGGGAILLEEYFKLDILQSKVLGDQFSNAKGFKKIGEVIFR